MASINEIALNGFKAFPSKFQLTLEGKNLLLYGENGSGKSSIYYALHCIFNSFRKEDKGKKYFDKDNPQNLINKVFTPKKEGDIPYILVNWKIGARSPFVSTITKDGCDPSFARLAELDTCFINHQFLFSFFNFTNSKDANLFPIFQREILPYIFSEADGTYISSMYEQIINASSKLSNKSSSKAINEMISIFNNCLEQIIGNINLRVSDVYNTNFKKDGELPLTIILSYPNVNPYPDTILNGFRLKWDYPLIVNSTGTLVKAPNKSLIEPIIRIDIKENGELIKKPHVYFNEAKLTAIALSIRFALLNLENPTEGSFLALDDMLISLDMSNRAKVVDFLLDISDRYKIYLFTHDKAFFEFVKHKSKRHIPVSEWLYKEIYMGENNSPYIRDGNSYLGEAEHYINQHKFEIAGNFLRKEAEAFCKRFLPSKWQLTKEYTCLDLNGMIQNCKKYAFESGISDLSLFDDLDDYRKFILNSSSHDSYDVVKFESEVRKCLETLKLLSDVTSRPVLKFGDKIRFVLKEPLPDSREFAFDIQICDELRVIEIPGLPKVLSKVMINYNIYTDGVMGKVQSSNQTLKKFYDINYKKSDHCESPNYLEGMKTVPTGLPLSSLL